MSNGQDPYADLLKHFQVRQSEYLRRLTTDEATFDRDPELNGTALRRGFFKGRGPRPSCSLLDQDNAAIAADDNHYLATWTDSPCLRASTGDPWEIDDLRGAIARLWVFHDSQAFAEAIPVPAPPDPSDQSLRFRAVAALVRQLTVMDRRGFRWKIRTLLTPPPMSAHGVPIAPIFDSALIERVVESLDSGPDPDRTDQAKIADLSQALGALVLEGSPAAMGPQAARDVLIGLYAVLPSDIVIDMVQAMVRNGSVIRPPASLAEPGTLPDEGSGLDSFGPHVPNEVWTSLATLSQFGRWEMDSNTASVRNRVLALSHWIWAPPWSVPERQPQDGGAQSLIQELFSGTWVPDGFQWPPYDQAGVYWWRSVIKHHCIDECFALSETADFHTTDLIRFLGLFPAPDSRIPDYVRTAAELALIWFKYWWDEPPSKKADGSDQAEMTMWSENHQILFAQSQLLAGALFRDRQFPRSGDAASGKTRTGQDHVSEGVGRVERWLDRRLKFGFSEWNAPGYYNEDLPPLFNLVDFTNAATVDAASDDERQALGRIAVKAAMVVDLVVFDFARFTCRGSFGVTAGRAYWEHKAYGWDQSIGNTIEILFGTRGDFTATEPAGVALATSSYDAPEALLAIGLDRVLLDRNLPFTDRTRVSINLDEGSKYGIGFDSEDDVLFWWGLEAYFTDQTLDPTKRVVQAHDNLRLCGPFEPLYAISDGWFKETALDLVSAAADAIQAVAGIALVVALPFPLDLIALGFEGKSILEGIVGFFEDLWDAIKSVGKAIGHALGLGDDKPDIPDTDLQRLVEKMLVAFNQGTVLSRANSVTYSNGDAMLSSVQNHLVGLMAFQKQPWMACLGLDACVWTTARLMSPDLGSYTDAMERFIGDVGMLHVKEAVGDILLTPGVQIFGKGDPFGHDGPNYWTGSLALPMIVQHENAAIIAYSIPALQRRISGASTHAWFPAAMFDETSKQDASGGTWFFGRKDQADGAGNAGSGYVALFTARQADWTNEPGNNWNGKEIMTTGGSNIWVCVVGNQTQFDDFDTFRTEVLNAYLHVSGVGSINPLECSFDIPRADAPSGRSPRLELFYSDRVGRFAGDDLPLDEFPRFENRYVVQTVLTGPRGSGLKPQVEGFAAQNSVGFGSTGYRIAHPPTGLLLDHDTSAPSRSHGSQADQAQQQTQRRRLQDGSVTPIRRPAGRPARTHPLSHPQLDRSAIRRRTP